MAERGNGVAAEIPASAPPPAAEPPTGGGDALDLKARLQRFGEILARGLDLAEAGMNLGLTIASTVGTAAQQKISERLFDTGGEPAAPPQSHPAEPEPPSFGITNRLPVVAGGAVSISFSINNESATAEKRVLLRLEGFAGDRGQMLPADGFRFVPAEAAIAPMDFEKFVIEGTIPAGAVPDIYRGRVLVQSDADIAIPVWIAVQPGGAP
jgi:hypothetical protein